MKKKDYDRPFRRWSVHWVVALASVLVHAAEQQPLAPQPKNFQEGTTVNGVDVSGLDAQGAAGAHERMGRMTTPSP